MKRFLALMLFLITIFTFVACDIAGEDDDDDKESILSIADIERNLERAGFQITEIDSSDMLDGIIDDLYYEYSIDFDGELECVAVATSDEYGQVVIYCFEATADAKLLYNAVKESSLRYENFEKKLSGKCVLVSESKDAMDIAFGKKTNNGNSNIGGGPDYSYEDSSHPDHSHEDESSSGTSDETMTDEIVCNGIDKHDYTAWEWTDATCTEPRTGTRDCLTCGWREIARDGAPKKHNIVDVKSTYYGKSFVCDVCGHKTTTNYINVAPNAAEISSTNCYNGGSTGLLTDGKWTLPFTFVPRGGATTITFVFAEPVDVDQISFLASAGAGTYQVIATLQNGEEQILGSVGGAGQAAFGDVTGPIGTMDQGDNATILVLPETLTGVLSIEFYSESSSNGIDAIGEIAILTAVPDAIVDEPSVDWDEELVDTGCIKGAGSNHSFAIWTWQDATCTSPRTGTRECETCGWAEIIEQGSELGHKFGPYQSTVKGQESRCGICGQKDVVRYKNIAVNASEISVTNCYNGSSTGVLTDGKWTIPFTFVPRGGAVTITFVFANPVDVDQISFLASAGAGTYQVTATLKNGEEQILGTVTGGGQTATGDTSGPIGTLEQSANATSLFFADTITGVTAIEFYSPSSSQALDAIGEIAILQK